MKKKEEINSFKAVFFIGFFMISNREQLFINIEKLEDKVQKYEQLFLLNISVDVNKEIEQIIFQLKQGLSINYLVLLISYSF